MSKKVETKLETHAAQITLASAEADYFLQAGGAFAASEANRGRMMAELADHLKSSGAATAYGLWEAARVAFIRGAEAKGYTSGADLWQQLTSTARKLSLIGDKPQAPSDEAARKRAERAPDPRSVEELEAAAKAAAKAGKLIDAGKLAKAAEDKAAKAEREAAKAAHIATAPTVERIRAALKRLDGDADKLGQLLALALKLSPEPKKTTPPGTSVKGRKGTPVNA